MDSNKLEKGEKEKRLSMVKVRRNRQRWKKWIAMLAVAATVTTSVQGMPVYTYASEVSASEANTGKVYYDGTYEGIGTGYKSATTKIAVTAVSYTHLRAHET